MCSPKSLLFKIASCFAALLIVFVIGFTIYGVVTQCKNVVIYHKDTGGSSCRVR